MLSDVLLALAILAALSACLYVLRIIGAVMLEWADAAGDDVPPPADHPYEPNGGARRSPPPYSLAQIQMQHDAFHRAVPKINGTLPGRRKDNTHERDAADPSTVPN